MKVSINTGGEEVGVSAPAVLNKADSVCADLFKAIEGVVVEPNLSAGVVEAQLTGRDLNDDIGVVSHALVGLSSERTHEVVRKSLVADTGRPEAVELDRVGEL